MCRQQRAAGWRLEAEGVPPQAVTPGLSSVSHPELNSGLTVVVVGVFYSTGLPGYSLGGFLPPFKLVYNTGLQTELGLNVPTRSAGQRTALEGPCKAG